MATFLDGSCKTHRLPLIGAHGYLKSQERRDIECTETVEFLASIWLPKDILAVKQEQILACNIRDKIGRSVAEEDSY